MKKIANLILTVFFIQLMTGCQLMGTQKTKTEEVDFDIQAAEDTASDYMKFLILEDKDNAKKLYSKDLLKESESPENKDLKITGCIIEESNRVGKTGVVKLKVVRSDKSKPYTVLESSTIKIVKEEKDYKIDEIKYMLEKECFLNDYKLRYREKDNVKNNLLIEMEGLPEYVFAREDKANLFKIPVPKDNFGEMAFSYGGERMAFSTFGGNCFYGIVNIDPSLAAAADGSDSGGGGAASGGAGDQGKTNVREKPIGKDIIVLDILKGSIAESMVFSTDEKYVAVQYKNNDNERSIKVYKADNGETIDFKFEDNFNVKEKDVVFKMFKEDKLNFQVVDKNTKNSGNAVQDWQLDLKTFKAMEV